MGGRVRDGVSGEDISGTCVDLLSRRREEDRETFGRVREDGKNPPNRAEVLFGHWKTCGNLGTSLK